MQAVPAASGWTLARALFVPDTARTWGVRGVTVLRYNASYWTSQIIIKARVSALAVRMALSFVLSIDLIAAFTITRVEGLKPEASTKATVPARKANPAGAVVVA